MPTDDEFRRVAEDVRALARSLARDVKAGVDQARQEGRKSGRVISEEVREAARQSREQIREATRASYRGHRGHWHGGYGYPPPPPPPPGEPGNAPVLAPRPPRPPRPVRAPSPPLRHRRDSSTVLGIVALVLGLSWLAAGTHLFAVPWRAAVAVALMVLGAAMVVTARTDWALSRRFWPVLLGAGLIVVLVLGSASFSWPAFGGHNYTWTDWTQVHNVVGSVGTTTIDMSHLLSSPPPNETLEVRRSVGTLNISLPPGLHVTLDDRASVGQLTINGKRVSGGFGGAQTSLGPPSPPTMTLEVRNAIGSVRIEQPKPAPATTPTTA